jgi:hypothetical protein
LLLKYIVMADELTFYNNCVKPGTGWSPQCSALLAANASQQWLQDDVYEIFKQFVPQQNLANPVANKLVAMTPDCLLSPQACQSGLNWACANSQAERYNKSNGYTSGAANRLCGCFSLPSSRAWQTNCYCQGSVPNLTQPLCLANICQIDNVSLTLINSQSGDVNLQQACGGYNLEARVTCEIANANIYVEDSSIGSLLLQQQCLTSPPNTITLNGQAEYINETGAVPVTDSENEVTRPSWLIIVFIIIMIIFIILSILSIIFFIRDIPVYRFVIVNNNNEVITSNSITSQETVNYYP